MASNPAYVSTYCHNAYAIDYDFDWLNLNSFGS